MTLTNPKPGGWVYGEKLTSTQASSLGTQLPYAIDGNAGGTYAPSGAINITGASGLGNVDFSGTVTFAGNVTWTGTTNLPKVGSRSYTYSQPIAAVSIGSGYALTASGTSFYWAFDASGPNDIWFTIDRLPNKSTLTGVSVYIDPAAHGSLPANMPTIELYVKALSTGVSTSLGTATDATVLASYPNYHAVTLSGLSQVIDGTQSLVLRLRGEYGANSAADMRIYGITATCTVTEIAPG